MYHIRRTYLAPGSRFIIGLDHSYHAIQRFPSSFPSPPDKTIYRSMLQEIITAFKEVAPDKLVVSGTALSQHDVKGDCGVSGVSKRILESATVIHPPDLRKSTETLQPSLHKQSYEQMRGSMPRCGLPFTSQVRSEGILSDGGDSLTGECGTGEAVIRQTLSLNFVFPQSRSLLETFDRVLRL